MDDNYQKHQRTPKKSEISSTGLFSTQKKEVNLTFPIKNDFNRCQIKSNSLSQNSIFGISSAKQNKDSKHYFSDRKQFEKSKNQIKGCSLLKSQQESKNDLLFTNLEEINYNFFKSILQFGKLSKEKNDGDEDLEKSNEVSDDNGNLSNSKKIEKSFLNEPIQQHSKILNLEIEPEIDRKIQKKDQSIIKTNTFNSLKINRNSKVYKEGDFDYFEKNYNDQDLTQNIVLEEYTPKKNDILSSDYTSNGSLILLFIIFSQDHQQ
jgi:hypothetical protein